MSDNQIQMPAAAQAGGAPGQYPPLNIPQSTMEANAMTDAMNNNGNGLNSPGSAGGPRRAAPEPNKRALYVGGLDPRVTEEVLKQIFETTGHVQSVKIIPDKNVSLNTTPVTPYTLHMVPHGCYRVSCLLSPTAIMAAWTACACMCIHHADSRAVCALCVVYFYTSTPANALCRTKLSNHHPLTTTFPSSSQKDSTTASLSTTILLPRKEPCRLSTEDVSTSR